MNRTTSHLRRRAAAALALGIVATVLAACGGGDDEPTATLPPATVVREVPVEMTSFSFSPEEFRFKNGDVVEFRLSSRDIEHTFTVKELGIDWRIRGGGTGNRTFTFTTPGEYELVCTIAGHEAAGMVGTLIVN